MKHASGIDPEKLLNGASLFLVALFLSIPLNWRVLVKLSLVLVIIEGSIRKWLLPGLSQFVYFGKDFLMIIAYAKYFSSKEPKARPESEDSLLKWFLIANSLLIMIQGSNFALGSPIIGLIGVRNYLIFIPLLFIVKDLFRTQDELATFLKFYLLLCIPVVGLSVIQYFAPADSFINIYVAEEDAAKALVGSNVRATGTFSYIAGFSSYLQVVAALVIPMLVLHTGALWHRVFQLVLVSVVVGIIFSGSRTPVIAVGLYVLGYLLCNKVLREMGIVKKMAVPLFVLCIFLIEFMAGAIEGMAGRFNDQHLGMRILASITTPFDYMAISGLSGYGSGATYQANGRIRELFGLAPGDTIPVFYESEPERVVLELGTIGFFFWYGFRLRLMAGLWRIYSSLSLPLLRELALSGFLLHAISFLGQMVFQVTFSFYYWFFAGLIYLLPILEKKELEQQREDQNQENNNHEEEFNEDLDLLEEEQEDWDRDRFF